MNFLFPNFALLCNVTPFLSSLVKETPHPSVRRERGGKTSTHWKHFLLPSRQNFAKGQVDARSQNLLADRETVIPAGVGRGLHHQQTPVGQLQPDHVHPPGGVFPSRVFVPEEEVSAGPKGDGGDGAPGVQFSFVIPVFPDVVTAIFVPAARKPAQVTERPSPRARQHRSRRLPQGCRACSASTGEPRPGAVHFIGQSRLITCFKSQQLTEAPKCVF